MQSVKQTYSVKAIIFDMDGVITNTMPDHYESWRIVLKDYGIDVTYLDIYQREGQKGLQSVKEISKFYGKEIPPDKAQRLLDEKEALFKKIVQVRFVDGSRAMIQNLHQRGFSLALVTGTSRHEVERILPVELRDLFHVIVTANEVKRGKPHPEPYLSALSQLKIESMAGIVVENAPLGIQSAKEAGLRCLALATSLPKEYLLQADGIFENIEQMLTSVEFNLRSS